MTNPNNNTVPLVIAPKTCVDKEGLRKNIRKNLSLISKWIQPTREHSEKAAILSAGPSLERYLDQLEEGATIFCVKHTLPLLKEQDIIPDFCVVLDPREIDGVSTHGQVRQTLFAEGVEETTFLVASMTHPSVTEYLLNNGHRVIGWHALVEGVPEELKLYDEENGESDGSHTLVAGGTSAAVRSLSLAHLMGYREADLYGFDSCFEDSPVEVKGVIEKLKVKQRDGSPHKEYVSSGELLAQAQDLEKIFQLPKEKVFLKLNCRTDGLVRELFDYYKGN